MWDAPRPGRRGPFRTKHAPRRRGPGEFRGDLPAARRSAAVPTEAQGEVTRLLDEVAAGNPEARNALFAQVYEQLHKMAHDRMSGERRGHSLGTTGLVHEVYLHLMKAQHHSAFTKGRAYFFAAAA